MNNDPGDILIQDGMILDPATGTSGIGSLYLHKGLIASLPKSIPDDTRIIKARGLWVVPGLIDVHVHLREPGEEHKETIRTGLEAAAAGGFTSVVAMPNTQPAIDHADTARMVLSRRPPGASRLFCASSLSLGRRGRSLVDMPSLLQEGVVCFTDDGRGLADPILLSQALAFSSSHGVVISQHCEDDRISNGGMARENAALRLGVRPWPADAEESMLRRDLSLLHGTSGRYHAQHLSSSGSVDAIRIARSQGLDVTSEVTPHHLFLTEDTVPGFGAAAKVNPPIGSASDRDTLRKSLATGLIDMVATDHAPHTLEDKSCDFRKAAFGIPGLETAVPLLLSLVHGRVLSPLRMIEAMSTIPARRFRLPGGSLTIGGPADVTIIDPYREIVIDPDRFRSMARVSPFSGQCLKGAVIATIVEDRVVFQNP